MGYEIIPLRLVWGMKDLMLQGYGIYGHVEPFALKQRPHFQPPALNVVNVRETDYNNGLTIWVGEGI